MDHEGVVQCLGRQDVFPDRDRKLVLQVGQGGRFVDIVDRDRELPGAAQRSVRSARDDRVALLPLEIDRKEAVVRNSENAGVRIEREAPAGGIGQRPGDRIAVRVERCKRPDDRADRNVLVDAIEEIAISRGASLAPCTMIDSVALSWLPAPPPLFAAV